MMTGWPSDCDIEAAMMRAITSVAPPVPKATTARIGLAGYCACSGGAQQASASRRNSRVTVGLGECASCIIGTQ